MKFFSEIFSWGKDSDIPSFSGRPFKHGVWDCYSLGRDWYLVNKAIELPDFPRDNEWWLNTDKEGMFETHLGIGGFVTVADRVTHSKGRLFPAGVNLKVGDGLLFSVQGKLIDHCGVYLGGNRFVHHFYGHLSRVDDNVQYWLNSFGRKVMRHAA